MPVDRDKLNEVVAKVVAEAVEGKKFDLTDLSLVWLSNDAIAKLGTLNYFQNACEHAIVKATSRTGSEPAQQQKELAEPVVDAALVVTALPAHSQRRSPVKSRKRLPSAATRGSVRKQVVPQAATLISNACKVIKTSVGIYTQLKQPASPTLFDVLLTVLSSYYQQEDFHFQESIQTLKLIAQALDPLNTAQIIVSHQLKILAEQLRGKGFEEAALCLEQAANEIDHIVAQKIQKGVVTKTPRDLQSEGHKLQGWRIATGSLSGLSFLIASIVIIKVTVEAVTAAAALTVGTAMSVAVGHPMVIGLMILGGALALAAIGLTAALFVKKRQHRAARAVIRSSAKLWAPAPAAVAGDSKAGPTAAVSESFSS